MKPPHTPLPKRLGAFVRHSLEDSTWSQETPNYGYFDFLLSQRWVNRPSGEAASSKPFESLPRDISMSHQSAYFSSVSMYLLSFLGTFFKWFSAFSLWAAFCHLQHSTDVFGSRAASDSQRGGIFLSSLFRLVLEAFSVKCSLSLSFL